MQVRLRSAPPSSHQPTPVGVFSPLLAGSTDSGLIPFLLSVFMSPVLEWLGTVPDPDFSPSWIWIQGYKENHRMRRNTGYWHCYLARFFKNLFTTVFRKEIAPTVPGYRCSSLVVYPQCVSVFTLNRSDVASCADQPYIFS
jgi:hypothetical protein